MSSIARKFILMDGQGVIQTNCPKDFWLVDAIRIQRRINQMSTAAKFNGFVVPLPKERRAWAPTLSNISVSNKMLVIDYSIGKSLGRTNFRFAIRLTRAVALREAREATSKNSLLECSRGVDWFDTPTEWSFYNTYPNNRFATKYE